MEVTEKEDLSENTRMQHEKSTPTSQDTLNWAERVANADVANGVCQDKTPQTVVQNKGSRPSTEEVSESSAKDFNLPGTYAWDTHVVLTMDYSLLPVDAIGIFRAITQHITPKSVHAMAQFRKPNMFLIKLANREICEKIINTAIYYRNTRLLISKATPSRNTAILVGIPEHVREADVANRLSKWATITKQQKLFYPDLEMSHVYTNKRRITFELKKGISIEDIPQYVQIATFHTAIFVQGRPPRCNFCSQTGHFRNQCTFPKCPLCAKANITGHVCNGTLVKDNELDAEVTMETNPIQTSTKTHMTPETENANPEHKDIITEDNVTDPIYKDSKSHQEKMDHTTEVCEGQPLGENEDQAPQLPYTLSQADQVTKELTDREPFIQHTSHRKRTAKNTERQVHDHDYHSVRELTASSATSDKHTQFTKIPIHNKFQLLDMPLTSE